MTRSAGVLPLSADTQQGLDAGMSLATPESFRAAFERHLTNVRASARVITCRAVVPTGVFLFESPTLRLTAEPFESSGRLEPFWLLDLFEKGIYDRCFSGREGDVTMRLASLGAAAQPIGHLPSLLNSTDRARGTSRLVESRFVSAVALAGEEWFEDGVESRFSRTLSTLLHTYGDAAVAEVEIFLGSPNVNMEVAVEAAQWLGEVDHPASRRYRRTLLEKTLLAATAIRLRHGAAAGIASMDDPSLLGVVMKALDRESNRGLRHFLELVADQLRPARACPSS